jgi:hypothetical protein
METDEGITVYRWETRHTMVKASVEISAFCGKKKLPDEILQYTVPL